MTKWTASACGKLTSSTNGSTPTANRSCRLPLSATWTSTKHRWKKTTSLARGSCPTTSHLWNLVNTFRTRAKLFPLLEAVGTSRTWEVCEFAARGSCPLASRLYVHMLVAEGVQRIAIHANCPVSNSGRLSTPRSRKLSIYHSLTLSTTR